MKKAELLTHWQALAPNQDMVKPMVPLEAGHRGKTYGMDGIRIDGSPEFIDAVLSHLKPLLEFENTQTRLQVSHADCSKAEAGFNKGNGGFVCYIRAAMRGREAQIMNAAFGLPKG